MKSADRPARHCEECGQPFLPATGNGNSLTCSAVCAIERSQRRARAYYRTKSERKRQEVAGGPEA